MNFKSLALEQLFKNFKWARNNTIEIFEAAAAQQILDYRSTPIKQSKYTFQPVLFQFQCIVSTTDTYFRKLSNAKNQDYAIYVDGDAIVQKSELTVEQIQKILPKQLKELEALLRDFDEEKTGKLIDKVGLINNHEHMHHGELIVMFRETGAELPERFVRSWAL